MAELEHVVKTFSLLEAAEKEQPFLTREQKQDLYRIAFHKESMEEVEKIILQLQVPHQSFGDGCLGAGFKRFPGIYPR